MQPKIYNWSGSVRVSKVKRIGKTDVALITWEKHRDDDFAVIHRLITRRGRPVYRLGNYQYRDFMVDL